MKPERVQRLIEALEGLADEGREAFLVAVDGLAEIADATPTKLDDRLGELLGGDGPDPDDTVSGGLAKVGRGVERLARLVPGGGQVADVARLLRRLVDDDYDDGDGAS